MAIRFVNPDTERLMLSDGDWIEVKRELNAEDDNKLGMAGFGRMVQVGDTREVNIDWSARHFARIDTYVVGWSLKDSKGASVPLTRGAIRNLSDDSVLEMDKAIQAHIEKMEQEKNAKTQTPNAPTSTAA